MTSEDRDFLHSLRRQQWDLRHSLERIESQLGDLEMRLASTPEEPSLPPVPIAQHDLPPVPPIPSPRTELPPLPLSPKLESHELPPVPEPPAHAPQPSLEFKIGRWLTRMGAVFVILGLISADSYFKLHQLLGPWGKFGLGGVLSLGLIIFGQRLERKYSGFVFYGRTLLAAGLASLYVTLYIAGTAESLPFSHHPFLRCLMLLAWSAYVLLIAEGKKSQPLSLFAITLAYFSTALSPLSDFTMAADLLLAATAIFFLLRHGWATLSYFAVIGTYFALLQRLVVDENGELVLDTSRTLSYWPHACYLIGAWILFTAGVILSSAPTFRGDKRLTFLSLNNGAFIGLLVLTAYIAGYGYGAVGWTLLDTGFLFLVTSRFAGWTPQDRVEVMGAYAAQGLALVTAGIITVYTGITRGVLLMLETFFLGSAAAFSRDPILLVTTHVSAFFATLFLIWEISINAHHPWLLGVGGAAVLFFNAWLTRGDIRLSRLARTTFVGSTAYYCALAIGLIFGAFVSIFSDVALPPALAFTTLALTFSIYLVALYELPPLAQTLLLVAQFLVLFPVETGEPLPWWSTASVAASTLLLLTWWSRQLITRTSPFTSLLKLIYALALVCLTYQALRPRLDAQDWLITSALLAFAFLVYGAFTRVWSIAIAGQVFLAISLVHFFFPENPITDTTSFPWTWWASLVPLVVVFSIGRAAHAWLRLSPKISPALQGILRTLAYGYQLLALAVLIRGVSGLIPTLEQVATFLLLGTLVFNLNRKHSWLEDKSNSVETGPSNEAASGLFGIRCSFVLSALGLLLYLEHLSHYAHEMATSINAFAFLFLLGQSAQLSLGKTALTGVERWALALVAAAGGWLFVSAWVETRIHLHYLTVGWAFYALGLFLLGLVARERRLRWCGLAILLASIFRVFVTNFWGFSNGYRVLTFVVLALILLGLGYIYARFAERLKMWL